MSHVRLSQAKGTANVKAQKLRKGLECWRSRKETDQCSLVGVSEGESGKMFGFCSKSNGKTWKDFEEGRHIIFSLKMSLAAVQTL